LIDIIFGTYYLPGKEWPKGTGVHEGNYPKGFLKQSVYPFTKSPFDNDLNVLIKRILIACIRVVHSFAAE
jgi:hypothetical protein